MGFLSYLNIGADLEEREYKYREVLVNTMLTLSMFVLSVFAVIHFFKGHLVMASIQLALSLAYAYAYFAPKDSLSKNFKQSLVIAGTIVMFLFLLIDGGIAKTGIYWVPFFPFMVFAVAGLRRGWPWLIVFTVGLIGILVLDYFDIMSTPYSSEEAFFFTFSFIFYVIVAVLFEGLRVDQQNQLAQRNDSLAEMSTKLNQTLASLEKEIENRTFELQESNRQLEQEVESHKRTNKHLKDTEQKFYQAQKMEALGTLVGGIAHDFNSILSGINANLFLIQRQIKDKPEVQGQLDDIERMVFHAADMTKQLLTFARKDNVEKKHFDMSAFMKEGIKLAVASLPSRIKLETKLSQDNLSILGNATQLQQVIMNLVNNARDALSQVEVPVICIELSPLQNVRHLLEKHPECKGRHWLHLSVSDNGKGILPADLPHIFDPFFTTKDIGKGTGLGLAMCYGAVQSHGGVIEVKSEIDKGTTFHIYLPVDHEESEITNTVVSIDEGLQGNQEIILLVDDDEALCLAYKGVLEGLGYQVILANNGLEAIKAYAASASPIDLVMMDIMMPEMGGIKAAQHILMMNDSAKIIFASGYEKDSSTERFLSDGFEQVDQIKRLNKPFTIQSLCQAIRNELDKK